MPSQEDVANQQELLAVYRRTLAQLLRQQAQIGELYAPPAINYGIDEARANIRRIKATLREWGVPVEDHPDDEPPARAGASVPPTLAAPRARRTRRPIMIGAGLALVGAIAAAMVALLPRVSSEPAHLQTSIYWSQCATSAVWVLPGTIPIAQSLDQARAQIAQTLATKQITFWQVAGLDPTTIIDGTKPGGTSKLYMNVRGVASGKVDIHVFNLASVTVSTQSSAQHADIVTFRSPGNFDCISGGGGAANRVFPPTSLTQQAQQYSDDKKYSKFDFFTLSTETSEVLAFPFECRSPGVYTIQIALRYRDNISATSGVHTNEQPATITCPASFTYWPITYIRAASGVDPPTVEIGTPQPFHWDGTGYAQGAN
jgi:hypothetical protein